MPEDQTAVPVSSPALRSVQQELRIPPPPAEAGPEQCKPPSVRGQWRLGGGPDPLQLVATTCTPAAANGYFLCTLTTSWQSSEQLLPACLHEAPAKWKQLPETSIDIAK